MEDSLRKHDRFSRQLACGFNRLMFDPDLEQEFRNHISEQERRPAAVCASLAFVVWSLFAAVDIVRLNTIDGDIGQDYLIWIWLGARWIVLAAFAMCIAVFWFTNWPYRLVAWLVFVGCGLAVSVTAAIARSKGVFAADSAGIIVVMAAFLPIGLVFYQALAAASIVAVFAIAVIGTAQEGRPFIEGVQLGVILLLAVPFGAIGAYLRERAEREQFLVRGVLSQQAMYDALTGIPNRRLFMQHAETVLAEARRFDIPVVLAMVDVDYFKKFNDEYGHPAGDDALQKIARQLASGVRRPMDMVARLGGEEFGVLLHKTKLDDALPILGEMVAGVQALQIVHRQSPHGVMTVSMGAAQWFREEVAALISHADTALYEAKASGRAKVRTAPIPSEHHLATEAALVKEFSDPYPSNAV